MKEKMQALLALIDTNPSPGKLLMACAPLIEAAESGAAFPDDAWILIPAAMRSGIVAIFCQLLLEAQAKK